MVGSARQEINGSLRESAAPSNTRSTGAAMRIRPLIRAIVPRYCSALRTDLADRFAVADLAARLAAWPRPIDILVNNAGTIARAPAAHHADADWDRVLQIDLSSQFVLARELGRAMLARGRGKIVFLACARAHG
jgi:NAD(P)-dependent dehydrogenase (short-subunit alcohol dehydrogenase family)